MSQENIDLIKRGYTAFRNRDMATIIEMLDPAIEVYQSAEVPWGGHYQGVEQIGLFFGRLNAAVDTVVEAERYLDAGEQILAIGHVHGTARTSGKAFSVPVVHVWTIKDGKVARFEAYVENADLLAALKPDTR